MGWLLYGNPVAGVRAHEEWMDPDEDGITRADARETDASGWAVFPSRSTHARLVAEICNRLSHADPLKTEPKAHVFVCWENQTGDVFWDTGNRNLAHELILRHGGCPYG